MSNETDPRDWPELQTLRQVLVEDWYRALRPTSYVPASAAEVRAKLAQLVDLALSAMSATPFSPELAQQVGSGLAELHYVRAGALGRTVGLFGSRLLETIPPDQRNHYQPKLVQLLEEMTTGYYRRACQIVLEEQEAIREALVTELRSAENALRQAHEHLEARVEQRTLELAEVNERLRAEIAHREQATLALKQREEQYRYLVENISDVIYSVGTDGTLVYVSPTVTEVLGYEPDAVLNRPFLDFVHIDDQEQVMQGYAKLMSGVVQSNEYRVRTKGGTYCWMRTSSRPVFQGDRVTGTTGLLIDIHEQKVAEIALRESEERWRSLVENAPDLIMTLNREGRITFLNRVQEGAENSVESLLGTEVTQYLLPEYVEPARLAIQSVFDTGERTLVEAALRSSSGALHWYSAQLGPVRRGERTVAVMVVARDVTERRRIAEMKDNLIRDVSHELRTPLAKAQMSLELLLELLDKEYISRERASRAGQMAFRSTERLLRTVEGILDLSALEAGEGLYAIEAIRPEELVDEVVRDMQPLATTKDLVLATSVASDLPPVWGEWDKLRRVLTNLVDNAIKFTDEGDIVITAQARGEVVEFAVRDPGQGILPENLDRIFERFYQEKIRFQGAGVGLAICKAIVEAHHGRIWAESAGRGCGATLRFTVPATSEEPEP